MRVHLGSDHAGFDLKAHLAGRLAELGHEPVDCGPLAYQPGDDYPPHVIEAARRTATTPGSLGIVLGGSGNGEAIAANKVDGVRAAVVWSTETAQLARQHNNANVISIGAWLHSLDEATRLAEVFLATSFSDDLRHSRRLDLVTAYETGRSYHF